MTSRFALILALAFASGPAWAEDIKTGYLIIEGQKIDPPFRVDIVDGKVLVNGIQTYPHSPKPREIAEEKEKKEAKELLDTMHEELVTKSKPQGRDKAHEWLKTELQKHPKHKTHTIRETKMGTEVNLTGVDDVRNAPYIRYMREDNAPSREKQISRIREDVAQRYTQWRNQHGKKVAMDMLEKELRKEPLVEDVKIDSESESYSIRWKGRPYMSGVGLRASGYPDSYHPTAAGVAKKKIAFQAEEIERPLRKGRCVIVFGSNPYSSLHGKQACDAVLQIIQEHPARNGAIIILSEHFRGREDYIWNLLERYWTDK